jgi:hypothetical protein
VFFQEMSLDTIDGLELQYDSKAGSKYYYTKKICMYPITGDAWLIVKWRLVPLEPETNSK